MKEITLNQLLSGVSVNVVSNLKDQDEFHVDIYFKGLPYFVVYYFGEDQEDLQKLINETCEGVSKEMANEAFDLCLSMTPKYDSCCSGEIVNVSTYFDGQGVKRINFKLEYCSILN